MNLLETIDAKDRYKFIIFLLSTIKIEIINEAKQNLKLGRLRRFNWQSKIKQCAQGWQTKTTKKSRIPKPVKKIIETDKIPNQCSAIENK